MSAGTLPAMLDVRAAGGGMAGGKCYAIVSSSAAALAASQGKPIHYTDRGLGAQLHSGYWNTQATWCQRQ